MAQRDQRIQQKAERAVEDLTGLDDYHELIRRVVNAQVGHEEWTGDVDPLASRALEEALTTVLFQLIENGTPEPYAVNEIQMAVAYNMERKTEGVQSTHLRVATADDLDIARIMTGSRVVVTCNMASVAYPIARLDTSAEDEDGSEHSLAALIDADGDVLWSGEIQ